MSKISDDAAKAFIGNESFKRQNTQVWRTPAGPQLYLHDNLIAKLRPNGLHISDGGYRDIHGCISTTTKSRLNALGYHYGFYIYQKNKISYLVTGGEEIEMEDGFYQIK